MKKIFSILASLCVLLTVGCSKNDDPDNGEFIKPDQIVADPTGTIILSMRNNDDTSLDGLYIGKDDNFHGNGWDIASLGSMKGLGNISNIPTAGWSDKIAVTPGYGYVAHNSYSDEYMRLYVTDYITSTTGGIIGADVKYQKPFKGLDEEIQVKKEKIVIPAEGGSEEIVFENKSIIPFKVSSSEDWCNVKKASTRDQNFLYDAVVISCEESYDAKEAKATVTIETLYGKKKEIEVTRAARGEFITLSHDDWTFNFSPQPSGAYISLFTNISTSDISINSSDDWLKAEFAQNDVRSGRRIKWIEGREVTRADLSNPVHEDLIIQVDAYAEGTPRTGTITFSHNKIKAVLTVKQMGSDFSISSTNLLFEAEENLTQSVDWYGNFYYSDLEISKQEDWIDASISNQRITITLQPNPYQDARKTILHLMYNNLKITDIEITQKGCVITDKYIYFESMASNYTLSFPVKPDSKITSSADWCSATPNGSSLVIRASATTEDRAAEISVEGIDAKIYVSQSKYKVGDTYKVGNIEASVYSMDGGKGLVSYKLPDTYQWSTEYIDIQGLSWNDGSKNMEIIKNIPGWETLYPAFAAVDALNMDGITGWYIPAFNEFSYYGNTGYYNKSRCWSSNQFNKDQAILCPTYSGDNLRDQDKNQSFAVCAVYAFSYDFSIGSLK